MDDMEQHLNRIWQGIAEQARVVNVQLDILIAQQEEERELQKTRLALMRQVVESIVVGATDVSAK
jgi:hypothetical protein